MFISRILQNLKHGMEFKHIQTAHCENGVITALLHHHGIKQLNEPLVFGIGSGIFYTHVPFIQFSGGPAIAFRSLPGTIFSRTCKALDVSIERKKFKHRGEAQRFVDEKVAAEIPVGCQVGVFHLSYFPAEYRFHFNAHNLIIYGREGNDYLISDPVMEDVTRLDAHQLERARFAAGPLAPKGHVYYPVNVPELTEDVLRRGIVRGIKKSVFEMTGIPSSVVGAKGIKYTAKKVRKLRDKVGLKKAGLYLGQIVRMQEEIGTGGGGFRFLYAAFLEQAADKLQDDRILKASDQLTQAGDMWRDSAMKMAGVYKGRLSEQSDFDEIADLMNEISAQEKEAFQYLKSLKLKA